MTNRLDVAAIALREVLREYMSDPYTAHAGDYVVAGHLDVEALKAADRDAERLNHEVYRRAVKAVLSAIGEAVVGDPASDVGE